MASTDARPRPLKNTAYRVYLAIRNGAGLDGALVTGWTGADSEVSKDGAAFTDATAEAIEIGTSGVGYLDLTAAEMNADAVVLKLTVTNAGAAPVVLTLYPEEASDRAVLVNALWDEVLTGATHNVPASAGVRLRTVSNDVIASGTAQSGTINSIRLAASASSIDGTYDPSVVRLVGGAGAGQSRLILQYAGSTRVATVARDWRTLPDATTEYEIIAAPNLLSTNEGLARGGTTSTITLNAEAMAFDDAYRGQTVVVRSGTGHDQSRLVASYNGTTKVATVGQAWNILPDTTSGYMMLPSGRAMTVLAEPGSITSASLAADAVTAIQAGLASQASVDAIQSKTDALPADPSSESSMALLATDVAAIKGQTDALPPDPAREATLATLADGEDMARVLSLTAFTAAAAAGGKVSGANTTVPANTIRIRDLEDTKDIVVATTDAHGNRTTVLVDLP